ncbi:PepSY domain-containing protein [Idiomarina seosinensis]|uniref:PepSY-associated TM helix domain-containing protein n=1 Tax=Idiomarina seosinensis TaxID=281739 RepID=UPI00384AF751
MKKQLHKIHGWTGIILMIPFLIVCLTGSIVVFKTELDAWLMPELATVDANGRERMPFDVLTDRINHQLPDYEIGSWEIFPAGYSEADRIFVIKEGTDEWHKAHLNPYTGELLSQPTESGHYLTDWLVELHYTLLLNDIDGLEEQLGVIISFVLSIFLVFMGISGLVIYRRFWARLFTLRWDQRLLVVFSDLHKMGGTLASPILLVIGITGGYYSGLIYYEEWKEHSAGEQHHIMQERLYADSVNIDALVENSRDYIDGFNPTYLLFPYEPEFPFTVFGRAPTANPLLSNYGSVVNFDAQTGEYLSTYNLNEQGVLAKTLDSTRRLHFGTFAGLTTKIIWCVVGLVPLLLAVTGGYLWWQRRSKRARKSRS